MRKTQKQFKDQWNEYAEELTRLAWNLPPRSLPRLNAAMDAIRDLITEAAAYRAAGESAGQPARDPQKVIVEVLGGVADVSQCPAGVQVEIIDHDNNEN